MSVRGDLSRKKILKAARDLFAAKGFSAVTMQDICDRAELSRGGLYRHYASTAQVFAAIIQEDEAAALLMLDDAKNRGIPPDLILFSFLRGRLRQLMDPGTAVDNATAEYAAVTEEGKALLAERARNSVVILTELLQIGVSQGVFCCENCREMALHIICWLEGMGKHNGLLPLCREELEAQLALMEKMLRA